MKAVIAAANRIDHRSYVWGGGHLGFRSRGYDCSGAVSYALHGGGLLGWPLVSGQLAEWGEAGVGRWITVYANSHHVYMVVAGLRYDTRDDPPGASDSAGTRRWCCAERVRRAAPQRASRQARQETGGRARTAGHGVGIPSGSHGASAGCSARSGSATRSGWCCCWC